jgi:hypothetical protein
LNPIASTIVYRFETDGAADGGLDDSECDDVGVCTHEYKFTWLGPEDSQFRFMCTKLSGAKFLVTFSRAGIFKFFKSTDTHFL